MSSLLTNPFMFPSSGIMRQETSGRPLARCVGTPYPCERETHPCAQVHFSTGCASNHQGLQEEAWPEPTMCKQDSGNSMSTGIKTTRKFTACETELDFSGETSNEVSKPEFLSDNLENLQQPLGKRSRVFEALVMEDSPTISELDDPPCPPRAPKLTKRKPSENPASRPAKLSFVCSLNHRSVILGGETTPSCQTCASVLGSIQRHALSRGGSVTNSVLGPTVTLACGLGHTWDVAYQKATKSWCKECKVKRREVLKTILEEETMRIEAEKKQRQNQLLEEARLNYLASLRMQKEEQKAEQDTFKIVFDEMTRLASKFAREYCQKDSEADYEQILVLYQTLIMPEKTLDTYFKTMSHDDLKKEFRRYTIMLHPDKNSHPKAKQAFQKAYALIRSLLD